MSRVTWWLHTHRDRWQLCIHRHRTRQCRLIRVASRIHRVHNNSRCSCVTRLHNIRRRVWIISTSRDRRSSMPTNRHSRHRVCAGKRRSNRAPRNRIRWMSRVTWWLHTHRDFRCNRINSNLLSSSGLVAKWISSNNRQILRTLSETCNSICW